MLIPRAAQATLRSLARGYPLVAVTGPRQSGKTTLVQATFPDKPYCSLEDLDQREFATQDPRGFLAQYRGGAVLDEIQRCPSLFSYLQTLADREKRRGLFVLTGSQQFGLLAGITQSLAGRVGVLPLLPFSLEELTAAGTAPKTLEEALFRGFYPPLYDQPLVPAIWHAGYVATYIERDVRQMVNVRDLRTFQRFIKMCASRTGQLLNLSGLAADCGITHNTAKAWISVLEASHILFLLPPYHRNFNKRLVKTPKLYFCDCGLAAWLSGIQKTEQLAIHPQRGPLFETLVIGELLKARYNQALASNLYFWRDRTGHEVDLIVETGDGLISVEIKSGKTVAADFFTALERWRGLAGSGAASPSWLVYGGTQGQSRAGTKVVAWNGAHELVAAVLSGSATGEAGRRHTGKI